MRTRTTLAAALLLATLTACGSSDSGTSAKPKAIPSSSPTKSYTFEDCKKLLEYDYEQGESKDASGDPECSHLTNEQYSKAVGEVLAAHKSGVLDQAARELVWDEAWDGLAPDKQVEVCDQIERYGVDAVGQQLKNSGAKPEGYETEMAQYYLDNKC
jgi:hypothetical protein